MRRFDAFSVVIATTLSLLGGFAAPPAFGQSANSGHGPEVRKLPVPGGQATEVARALSMRYRTVPGVTISADKRSGDVVVMAPPAAHAQIASDTQVLSRGGAGRASGGVRMASVAPGDPLQVRLAHVTWREFEDGLQSVAGRNVPVTTTRNGERASFQLTAAPLAGTTVEVDRRGNSVTVIAPEPKLKGWQKIIASIDQMPKMAGETTEIRRLQNADPAPIQRAVRLLRELESAGSDQVAVISGKTYRTAVFQNDAAEQRQRGGDGRVNAGGGDGQNDNGRGDDGRGDDGRRDAADGDAAGGSGVIGDTQIQFVPELGVIIVKGAKRDVDRVQSVIAEIEKNAAVTQPDVQIRQLDHADCNAVAALLQQLYEDVLSARTGEVSITPLDAPNALLLIGRQEAIANVLDLVEKIDRPISETDRLRVFRLQHASAVDAEETIRSFFTASPGDDQQQRPGLGFRVRILADYRTNSLIVSASPRDMNEVTRLVNELDVEQTAAQSEIKVFTLNNARAEDLAPTLQTAINGQGERDDDGQNATSAATALSIVTIDESGQTTLDAGVLSGAVVTADTNANAVVVRAPASSMPLIAELIRQLDRAPGIDSLVKVFTANNGDATQLAQSLETLFGSDAGTSGTSVGAGNLGNLASSTASQSALVPLRFTTDIRTNSIIVSGSGEDLEVVESILLRLDSEGFSERITEVIWLRHQIADNIATAITNYVSSRAQSVNQIQQAQQGLSPYDLPDRDLIVVPEERTNSLLLSVSPRLYEDVRRLIDNLDRRPPMVLIKTIIAEVNLDDRFEIGGEVGVQDSLLFDRGVAGGASDPGFNFNNNGSPNLGAAGRGTVAGRALSTFGVGTSSTAAGVGGFVLSAASDSISLLFRTLQTAGRLQIISRPQIMTLDNTTGFLTNGQLVARPQEVTNNQNNTSIGVTDIDVGLILQVTPRVGSDGLIVMQIDATRSSVNNTAPGQIIGVFNGAPVTVPPIDRVTAQSTISAYSGQTVIYGGLIQKTRENISRRVPIVSEIPLLGHMFRFDQEVESRSELLIVMTPMIVNNDEDLDYVKATESSRMSWCLADVVEAHGDVGLSGGHGLWGPADGATIYPDLQPTVDDFDSGGQRILNERVIEDRVIESSVNESSIIGPGSSASSGDRPGATAAESVSGLPAPVRVTNDAGRSERSTPGKSASLRRVDPAGEPRPWTRPTTTTTTSSAPQSGEAARPASPSSATESTPRQAAWGTPNRSTTDARIGSSPAVAPEIAIGGFVMPAAADSDAAVMRVASWVMPPETANTAAANTAATNTAAANTAATNTAATNTAAADAAVDATTPDAATPADGNPPPRSASPVLPASPRKQGRFVPSIAPQSWIR